MDKNAEVLIGVVALVFAVVAAFAGYRWRQRGRARRVEQWVRGYLRTRYGELPDALTINCSDDPLWPVLVAFDRPRQQTRHRLQFSCPSSPPSFALLAETQEPRPGALTEGPRTGTDRVPGPV